MQLANNGIFATLIYNPFDEYMRTVHDSCQSNYLHIVRNDNSFMSFDQIIWKISEQREINIVQVINVDGVRLRNPKWHVQEGRVNGTALFHVG